MPKNHESDIYKLLQKNNNHLNKLTIKQFDLFLKQQLKEPLLNKLQTHCFECDRCKNFVDNHSWSKFLSLEILKHPSLEHKMPAIGEYYIMDIKKGEYNWWCGNLDEHGKPLKLGYFTINKKNYPYYDGFFFKIKNDACTYLDMFNNNKKHKSLNEYKFIKKYGSYSNKRRITSI